MKYLSTFFVCLFVFSISLFGSDTDVTPDDSIDTTCPLTTIEGPIAETNVAEKIARLEDRKDQLINDQKSSWWEQSYVYILIIVGILFGLFFILQDKQKKLKETIAELKETIAELKETIAELKETIIEIKSIKKESLTNASPVPTQKKSTNQNESNKNLVPTSPTHPEVPDTKANSAEPSDVLEPKDQTDQTKDEQTITPVKLRTFYCTPGKVQNSVVHRSDLSEVKGGSHLFMIREEKPGTADILIVEDCKDVKNLSSKNYYEGFCAGANRRENIEVSYKPGRAVEIANGDWKIAQPIYFH